jgi:ribonuclease D
MIAQLLGFEQIGLPPTERFFTITIGKEGQKSDWSRRPLSENQLRYAVNDTRFLERLADRMHGALSARGRVDWHRESCRAMVESSGRAHARDPENAWRIKGAGRLTRRQLAYLRELWRWRDQHARSANCRPSESWAIKRSSAWSNGRSLTRACRSTRGLNCRATSPARS